ncbi:MAG TPA: nucleotide exchange factor GrpE [Pirellulaceae bacterium]|nr:nucleotide exchange factor GrpE [Pirellulaceae bacterium]
MTDTPNTASDDSNAQATDLALELETLRIDLQDANDRVLRSQAEFENYRKRAQREMLDERKYASYSLINDILGVLDNLDLAIQAAEKNPAAGGLLQGVSMVAGMFNNVLAQHGCTRIEGVGQPFDPNLQQAIAQEASAEHPAGTVTRVTRFGYQLHDRVVRPAQVFVSTGPAAA